MALAKKPAPPPSEARSTYEVVSNNTRSQWVGETLTDEETGEDVKVGKHYILKHGDKLELTEDEAAALGDAVAPYTDDTKPAASRSKSVAKPKTAPKSKAVASDEESTWSDIVTTNTVAELRSLIASIDEVSDLESLIDAENKLDTPRATVISLAERRIETIQG